MCRLSAGRPRVRGGDNWSAPSFCALTRTELSIDSIALYQGEKKRSLINNKDIIVLAKKQSCLFATIGWSELK
jgi:hypothetical protein